MSKAFKCDRCKRCFDPLESEGEFCTMVNPVFQTAEDYEDHKTTHYMHSGHTGVDALHLCPDCAHEFKLFMKNWKVAYQLKEGDDLEKIFRENREAKDSGPLKSVTNVLRKSIDFWEDWNKKAKEIQKEDEKDGTDDSEEHC